MRGAEHGYHSIRPMSISIIGIVTTLAGGGSSMVAMLVAAEPLLSLIFNAALPSTNYPGLSTSLRSPILIFASSTWRRP